MSLTLGRGMVGGRGAQAAPVLASISPELGDIYAGTPVEFTFTGSVTSATIGGLPVTSIVTLDAATACGYAPALAAGTYDVIVSGPGGTSNTLTNAYQAWHPNVLGGLLYESTQGVTGNPATALADQGGGAGASLIGTGGTAPALVASRFGDNTRPALIFDIDVFTELAFVTAVPVEPAFSRFWVCKKAGFVPQGTLFAGPGGSILNTGIKGTATAGIAVYEAQAGIDHQYGAGLDTGSPAVYGFVHEGTAGVTGDGTGYYNGEVLATPDSFIVYANTYQSWQYTGGTFDGNPFGGELACVFQANTALSASNIAKISQWMFGKFCARSYGFNRVASGPAWTARDGALLFPMNNGDIVMFGGWNSQPGFLFDSDTSKTTNEVYVSTDQGVSWSLRLAGDYTYDAGAVGSCDPADRPTPRHAFGAAQIGDDIYIIGSDPFNGPAGYYNLATGPGTSDVWKTSDGGLTYTLQTTTGAFGPVVLHMCGADPNTGVLYCFGGQTDLADATTVRTSCFKSIDQGVTWTAIASMPLAVGIVMSPLPFHDGKLWVIGGGAYDQDAIDFVYRNSVMAFDTVAETWTTVSADGVAPWVPRIYPTTKAFEGKLWVINGGNVINYGDVWSSSDGVTWTEQTITPWRTSHADGAAVLADRIVIGPGNGDVGQPSGAGVGHVHSITRNSFAIEVTTSGDSILTESGDRILTEAADVIVTET